MKIRIKFCKHGAIRYIGHLDVMRYFQKAVRRAGIDIKYSGGMSPHQIMSFAQPLGVGYESDGEYLDIEVNSSLSSEESVEKLNAVMSEGITVMEYKELPEQAKNAMSCITAADYHVGIRKEYIPQFDIQSILTEFMKQEQILIQKKSKRGEREIDLKPYLYQIYIHQPQQFDDFIEKDTPVLFMQLSAGSELNIKPRLVMEAIYESAGMELPEYALHIIRKELYTTVDGVFVPLGSIGTDISK